MVRFHDMDENKGYHVALFNTLAGSYLSEHGRAQVDDREASAKKPN